MTIRIFVSGREERQKARTVRLPVRTKIIHNQSIPAEKIHIQDARGCILYLLRPDFVHEWKIGQYIHRNFEKSIPAINQAARSEGDLFHEAYENWASYLATTSEPSIELLQLAQTFLSSFQFATWSEYSLHILGGYANICHTEYSLRKWRAGLSEEKRSRQSRWLLCRTLR